MKNCGYSPSIRVRRCAVLLVTIAFALQTKAYLLPYHTASHRDTNQIGARAPAHGPRGSPVAAAVTGAVVEPGTTGTAGVARVAGVSGSSSGGGDGGGAASTAASSGSQTSGAGDVGGVGGGARASAGLVRLLQAAKQFRTRTSVPGATGASGAAGAAAASGGWAGQAQLQQQQQQFSPHPLLRQRQVQRALYLGDTERLRSFVRRMAEGENVTIALLGGSVSRGMGAVVGEPSFEVWLRWWLAAVAPGPAGGNTSTVRMVNAACAATSSAYMNLCLGEYLPDPEVDLVLLEYGINDEPFPEPVWENEPRKSFEQLLRKLLLLPRRPAVVLLNVYRWHTNGIVPGSGRPMEGLYYSNTDSQFFEFATFYGLPMISLKAAVYHQMVAGERGFQVHQVRYVDRQNATSDPEALFYEDPMHPSGLTGHKVIFELITGLMLQVARGLVHRPYRQSEADLIGAPLPPHLIPGNLDTDLDLCVLGDRLREAAVEIQGFEWRNEGRNPLAPKWGFTATAPGSSVTFTLPTPTSGSGAAATAAGHPHLTPSLASPSALGAAGPATAPGPTVLVIVAYLRSYENMGVALVACGGGCQCGTEETRIGADGAESGGAAVAAPPGSGAAALLDGHWDTRNSQLQLGCFRAVLTDPPACRISVRVTNATRSGAHKVKIGGLIVSHTAIALAHTMCITNLEAAERAAGFRER